MAAWEIISYPPGKSCLYPNSQPAAGFLLSRLRLDRKLNMLCFRKDFAMTKGTAMAAETEIRPFQVKNVSAADLNELRRLIKAPKGPERERVTHPSLGIQISTMPAHA